MIYHYNETPIFYSISGKGPTVVLLHGFLESSTMWSSLVPSLSLHNSVLVIDLPGHGKTGSLTSTHSMEMMADVVHQLLTHLQIDCLSMIGHSMGGYVGLAFLEAHGQMVKAITLLNSTTKADSNEQKHHRDRAAAIVSENKETFIGTIMNFLFVENSQRQFASEIAALKKEAMGYSTEGIIAAIQGMRDRPDRTEVLQKYEGDKLIICGDQDLVVPISVSKEMAAVTNSPLKILNGGHMSWIENTPELLKLCT